MHGCERPDGAGGMSRAYRSRCIRVMALQPANGDRLGPLITFDRPSPFTVNLFQSLALADMEAGEAGWAWLSLRFACHRPVLGSDYPRR